MGVAELVATTLNSVNALSSKRDSLDNQLNDEHLKNLMKESSKDWFDDNLNEILNNITLNLSESIVGESYIKYDSATSYFPTLVFKFKPVDKLLKYNYSQIKIRYYKKPDDISDTDVLTLKQKIDEIK